MIVINLFGAPNSGKTGTAASLFGELKRSGVEVEYIPEAVRMAYYTNNQHLLGDELSLLASKNSSLTALKGAGIQVAITDGPVLNSMVYKPKDYFPSFDAMVLEIYNSYNNINLFIPGVRNFSPIGRGESNEDQASERGRQIAEMLSGFGYHELSPEKSLADQAFRIVMRHLDDFKQKKGNRP